MQMTTRSILGGVAVGGLSTLALSFGSFDRAQAATISTLYNTGVDASGAVTFGTDIHYTLSGPGVGASPQAIPVSSFPANVYNGNPGSQGNDSISAWIGPSNGALFAPIAQYTYTTTFDLTGLDASTAAITGRWNTDNAGLKLILNGVDIAATNAGFDAGGFSTFSLSSGFNATTNTLAFVVDNTDGGDGLASPNALRVEFLSATADIAPVTEVPEPSDLVGTAFAFGSVVLLKRKLSKKTVKSDRFSK
jgi:hypothetical protein